MHTPEFNFDFSRPKDQKRFEVFQKQYPETVKEFVNLEEVEAWDENLSRYAKEHYKKYASDKHTPKLLKEIQADREDFEDRIAPKISSKILSRALDFLGGRKTDMEWENLLKQANFDFEELRKSPDEASEKANELISVVVKQQTYDQAIQWYKNIGFELSGFGKDDDFAGLRGHVLDIFGKEIIDKCLISKINCFPDRINVSVGGLDYFLPPDLYKEWESKMPQVKEHTYRAESCATFNTDHKFSKKFVRTPINIYSFYAEEVVDARYLQEIPEPERKKVYKIGTVFHEIAHHIYGYMMDADKRVEWKNIVDRSGIITDYSNLYVSHKRKYEEAFTESIRLKTTTPRYLIDNFPEIDKFIKINFPDIKSI
ncbi:MAG: hypothetical protein Q8R29_00450 [bacterium]|nr:hypothetical protein [bacterium]